MLSAEETQILNFLKIRPGEFVPESEISRRVGGKALFHSNPTWARRPLASLVEAGLVEQDERGFYRTAGEKAAPPPAPATRATKKQWVSPQIASILKKSGMRFEILENSDSES